MKHIQPENDPDQIINHFSGRIRSTHSAADTEACYQMFREKSTGKKTKRIPLFRYGIAAAIVLLLIVSAFFLKNAEQAKTVTVTTAGYTTTVTLPDGSHIQLGHYSEIEYPCAFAKATRPVKLTGKAYFDVTHNPDQPFIVTAGEVTIQVLGTQFNVNAYPENPYIKTTLLEGSVSINDKSNGTLLLHPNESALFWKESNRLVREQATDVQQDIAWREKKLIFNNTTLNSISRELANHFNIEIEITGPVLGRYRFTARFENGESPEEILNILQAAGNFTWAKQDNKFILKHK